MLTEGDRQQERISEARLRQFMTHLPFFACMINRERRFTWVNRLDDTLQLAHVIGRTLETFVHPNSRQVAIDAAERAFETQTATYYEVRGYAEGEMETWYGVRVVPLPAETGEAQEALVLSTDISQRRDAESALRESEARFRMLTEASPDYVAVLDHERRCEYLNRMPIGGEEARLSWLGRRIDDVFRPEERTRIVEALQNVLETGCSASFDWHGPQTGRPYVTRALPLPGPVDKPRTLLVTTDVSEQRAAEAHRRTLESQLAQAQKMESIGQLAGGVAHDFNNMIMVMGLHLEAARDYARNGQLEGTRHELDQIETASKRAADLTRQLLAFARRQPHQPSAAPAADLTANAMRLLRRLIPASIKLNLHVRAPDAWVMADSGLIEQVIMNLCVNARDAIRGHAGTITVEVDRRVVSDSVAPSQIPPGRWVTIAVADTGCGIAEKDLPRIFEPFYTTKSTGQGTGLGLSMVHGIVTQHQGFVTVDTKLGEGSVLTVFLPEVVSTLSISESQQARPATPERARILVAEDEPMVRRLVANLLRRAGHTVVEAENGVQAVRLVESSSAGFDLLVLDAVMPEMGGKECYERIRAMHPKLPAIFSSGYSGDMLPSEFLREHGLRLIAKPYDSKTLIDAVAEALARNGAR